MCVHLRSWPRRAVRVISLALFVLPSSVHVSSFSRLPPKGSVLPITRASRPSLIPLHRSSNKWDNLAEEDADGLDMGDDVPGPRDMRYIEHNVLRQNKFFVAIREAAGPEATDDVYSRAPGSNTWFFVGKTARVSDVSSQMAVARQWSLIETHASRLRPIELFPKKGVLELWVAPGDSEMDVAYNRPTVRFVEMKRPESVPNVDNVRNVEVGFQGEMYEGGEEGFRTQRTDDGMPARPEITDEPKKGPKRAPTDEEYAEIQEILKGKDPAEFFDD